MAKAKKRPAEAWTYILKSDRALPQEEQSRFTLRPMTYVERAALLDDLQRTDIERDGRVIETMRVHRNAWALALAHIVAVENFPAGEPQPWPEDRAAREHYMDQIDNDDVLEIGNEIWTRSGLGIEAPEIKNSSPPGLTSISGGISAGQASTTAPSAPSSLS